MMTSVLHRALAVQIVLLAGCGTAEGDANRDAAPDAAFDWGEGGPLRQPDCPAEPEEDCLACFERVAVCCYEGDALAAWNAATPAMADACSANPLCEACCNECAQMQCAEMEGGDICPAAVPCGP